jgi:excisionase family DNA binding protein
MNNIIVMGKNDLDELINEALKSNGQSKETKTLEERFLSIDEAASYLNLARQTVYGLTSKRLIPFLKKGKKLYFIESELKNWLLSGRKDTKEDIKRISLQQLKKKGAQK